MKRLFEIDLHDYEDGDSIFRRSSVRGIILVDSDRIALVYSQKEKYYKFPGGGINKDEDKLHHGRKYHGRGYAKEVSLALFEYGFNTLHLESIVAETVLDNKKSIATIMSLGMKTIEIYQEDLPVWIISRNDYDTIKKEVRDENKNNTAI